MLKHCSQSCVDVSRRSLRHNSFTLDSRFNLSTDNLDEINNRTEQSNNAEFRSFCGSSNASKFSGLVTLPRQQRAPKPLSESCMSLPSFTNVSAIKVYAQCLRPHLAYKTVIITRHTTSRQVVLGLLSRFRMKHRDPRLFYLTMEVNIGDGDKSRTISLEDSSCIADLISCNPWGTCRFRLKARQGGLVKIYDGAVRTDSIYKSIIISQDTTVADTVDILESCYAKQDGRQLELVELDQSTGNTRLLDARDKLLELQDELGKDDTSKVFQLRHVDILTPPTSPLTTVTPSSILQDSFSRAGLVRNSVLRQSVRKKQFLKSMIITEPKLELQTKQLFSLSRFTLSDQIISESEEECGGSGTVDTSSDESGEDLNCSTSSGVSSLSCSSSLDSIPSSLDKDNVSGDQDSFFT